MCNSRGIDPIAHNCTRGIDIVPLGNRGSREGHTKADVLSPTEDEAVPDCGGDARIPSAHQVAASINPRDNRVAGAGKVYLCEVAGIPGEPVLDERISTGVENVPSAYDGTGVIDTKGVGVAGPGKIRVVSTPLRKRNP